MKTHKWTGKLLAPALAISLGGAFAFAQTAGQDMKDAGHETKEAAKDTGHATKRTTKTAARKTKNGAKTVGHDTKEGVKETGRRTENAGDALAGKPEKH
jgi:hypothetical protein